jgi:hypothetical protein
MDIYLLTSVEFIDVPNPVKPTCINVVDACQIEITGDTEDRLNTKLVNATKEILHVENIIVSERQ